MANRNNNRILGIVGTTLLAASLAACGSNNDGAAGAPSPNAGSEAGKPLSLSIMTPLLNAQPPKGSADNPVQKKLEELSNSKWDINYVPNSGYEDKLNVAIASGNLPQAVVITKLDNSAFLNAARNGQFWEVTPFLKDYPNLMKGEPEITLKNASIEGKLYGVPRARVVARVGLIIRQDWLDALGLKAPTNSDEFYTVMKAFTEKDPDKNGKADTFGYGFVSDPFWGGLASLSVPNGAPNGWGLKDGKATPNHMDKAYDDAITLVKKMYDEKLMQPDFAAPGYDVKKMFREGKVGAYFSAYDDNGSVCIQGQQNNPNLKCAVVPAFKGTAGELTPATSGHAGLIAFPKSSVKTEADLRAILTVYDKLNTPEAVSLQKNGLDGVHYKSKGDGTAEVLNRQDVLDQVAPILQFTTFDPTLSSVTDQAEKKLTLQYNKDYLSKAVPNIADSLVSQTFVEKGAELKKIISDASVKYIMGGNLSEWEKAKQTWLERGGSKVIEEYTAAYNAANKK
jgi:putative aldouronate transport system substrate-binding protein